MGDKNEYQIIIELDTTNIENDIDTRVSRHIDVFSRIVHQKVEMTVIDANDVTVKAVVDDLFNDLIEPVLSISAYRVIHDPCDDRWQLVYERHIKESK